MMRRTLARVFALLALAAAAVAILLIVQHSGGTSSSHDKTKSTKTSKSGKSHRAAAKPRTGGKKTPRVYVVKPGDTLSRIAQKTHVSVSVIQELNPNLDPTVLQAGQKIKLKS
jgi:LysM repeat protein